MQPEIRDCLKSALRHREACGDQGPRGGAGLATGVAGGEAWLPRALRSRAPELEDPCYGVRGACEPAEAPSSRMEGGCVGAPPLALEAPVYSIRIPRGVGLAQCARCRSDFLAAGPTGHRDGQMICDVCLLECDAQLGMVLALVAVTRTYGAAWPRDAEEESLARRELLAFARVFERHAAQFAPARPPGTRFE